MEVTGAPNIVVIGGGSGSSVVLEGLKGYACKSTAIVTMFDSGGSSGLLRDEFGFPPLGDLRRCLVALSEDNQSTDALKALIDFRFHANSSLNGHNLGNLLMAALTALRNDVEGAIDEMSRILGIRGQVLPVTLDNADLCAELEDGSVVRGESSIDLRKTRLPHIRRIFLDPAAKANQRAIQAIHEADIVVLGPGDLYTSVLPNLLATGIPEAIRESDAVCVYVCNLMTKCGETDGFRAQEFVSEVNRYLGGKTLDWVFINNRTIPPEVCDSYRPEGAIPVEFDLEGVRTCGVIPLTAPLSNNQLPLRHDSRRLAQLVFWVARTGAISRGRQVQNVRPGPQKQVLLNGSSTAGEVMTSG